MCPLTTPLKRIKLKLFGHSNVGKSTLVHALQQTFLPSLYYNGSASAVNGSIAIKPLNSIVDAVSRRLSDNLLMSSINHLTSSAGISHSHPAISNVSFLFYKKMQFFIFVFKIFIQLYC